MDRCTLNRVTITRAVEKAEWRIEYKEVQIGKRKNSELDDLQIV